VKKQKTMTGITIEVRVDGATQAAGAFQHVRNAADEAGGKAHD